jgi:hypothetical protein
MLHVLSTFPSSLSAARLYHTVLTRTISIISLNPAPQNASAICTIHLDTSH